MIRDFVAGILWGGVVAGVGLGVVSQVAPLGARSGDDVTLAASAENTPSDAPEVAPAAPSTGQAKPEPTAPGGTSETAGTQTSEPGDETVLIAPETTAPKMVDPADDTVAALMPGTETPGPKVPEVGQAPSPSVPDPSPTGLSEPEVGTPAKGSVASEAVAENTKPKEADPESSLLAKPEIPKAALPKTDDAKEPVESLLEPGLELAPQQPLTPVVPDVVTPAVKPAVLEPSPALTRTVDGVTIGRLPAIGKDSADIGAPADALAEVAPILRYARAFENPASKPLFAIFLIDPGTPEIDRKQLAALPFAVSFVVDPLAANAREAASIYRAGGQEVVMLASGIPKGATASDLEQTFQAHAATLSEAVAVIDLASGGFQDDRVLANQMVQLLKAQGRGLITFDQGLNAADQVARREGVSAAVVFRTLDDGGEDAPVIRRYLDRAAFKAAQEGRVAVIGTARPETIAALLEWTVEGRAASVALAPATAVMTVE